MYHDLQRGLGLGLPGGGILHRALRGGKVGLDVRDGLLARLRRQIGRDALAQRIAVAGEFVAVGDTVTPPR